MTPVFVYTSGDSAELFLNGKSLGKRTKGALEYRLRWDDVVYQPGELHVVAYKNGQKWAEDTERTAGDATKLTLSADRMHVPDGGGLVFLTASVVDAKGTLVPRAHPHLTFAVEGAGSIVATDNGDATSHEPFQSVSHDAYNGLCLGILKVWGTGPVHVIVSGGAGLGSGSLIINAAQ